MGNPGRNHFEGIRTKSTSEFASAQFMARLEDGVFTKISGIFPAVVYSQKVLDQPL